MPPRRHDRIASSPAWTVARDAVSGVIGVPHPRFGPLRASLLDVEASSICGQLLSIAFG